MTDGKRVSFDEYTAPDETFETIDTGPPPETHSVGDDSKENEKPPPAEPKAAFKTIKVDSMNKKYGTDPVTKKSDKGKNGFVANNMPLNPKNGLWWTTDYNKTTQTKKKDPLKGKRDDPLRKKYGQDHKKGIYRSNYPTNPKNGMYMGIDGLAGASAMLKEKKRKETMTVESHELKQLRKQQKLEEDKQKYEDKQRAEEEEKQLKEEEKKLKEEEKQLKEEEERNIEEERRQKAALLAAAGTAAAVRTELPESTQPVQESTEANSNSGTEAKNSSEAAGNTAAVAVAGVAGAATAAAVVGSSHRKKDPVTRHDPLRMKYGYDMKKGGYAIRDLKDYKVKDYKFKAYESKTVRNDNKFIQYIGEREYKMNAMNAYWGWRPTRHATPVEKPPPKEKTPVEAIPKPKRKRTNSDGDKKHTFYNDRFDRVTKLYMVRPYNKVKEYKNVKEYNDIKQHDKFKRYIGKHEYKMTPFNTYWGYRDMLHPKEKEKPKEEPNEEPKEEPEEKKEEEKVEEPEKEEEKEEEKPKTPERTPSPNLVPLAAAAVIASEEPKKKEEPVEEPVEKERTPTPKPKTRTPSPENLVAAAAIVAVATKDRTPTPKPATPKPATPKQPTPPPKSRSPSPNIIGAAIIGGAIAAAVRSPTPKKEPTPKPPTKDPTPEPEPVPRSPSPDIVPVVAAAAVIAHDPTPTPKPRTATPPPKEPTPPPAAPANRRIISPDPIPVVAVAATRQRKAFIRPQATWEAGDIAATPSPLPGPAEHREPTIEKYVPSPSPSPVPLPAVIPLAEPVRQPKPQQKAIKKSKVAPQPLARPEHQGASKRTAVSTPTFERAAAVTPVVEAVEEFDESAENDVWAKTKASADNAMSKISRMLKV